MPLTVKTHGFTGILAFSNYRHRLVRKRLIFLTRPGQQKRVRDRSLTLFHRCNHVTTTKPMRFRKVSR